MNQVSEVMIQHPEFCNTETRVPDIKYIIKKYNYDEIVIVDNKHYPIGIVKAQAVSDDAMKNILHPFDVKAEKLMNRVSVTVKKDASLSECLQLMERNHMTVLPVIDNEGHCLGVVKKEDLLSEKRH